MNKHPSTDEGDGSDPLGLIGQTLGKYEVLELLGTGGMGIVYLARHVLLERRAALKVLRPQYCWSPKMVQRFLNEAMTVAALRHPGLVEIHDYGADHQGRTYFAMEYLQGESLSTRLARRGRLEEEEALRITRQVVRAVCAAHAKGIVHRDLKPDNVFLVADPDVPGGERVKVFDFGVAKLYVGPASPNATETGALVGSPAYMAPEQCVGSEHIDHRADYYSLGCCLFEMVCGARPFSGGGTGGLMVAHLERPPPKPRSIQPTVSVALEAVILRLLAKDPADRFPGPGELLAALGDGGPTLATASGTFPTPAPFPGATTGTTGTAGAAAGSTADATTGAGAGTSAAGPMAPGAAMAPAEGTITGGGSSVGTTTSAPAGSSDVGSTALIVGLLAAIAITVVIGAGMLLAPGGAEREPAAAATAPVDAAPTATVASAPVATAPIEAVDAAEARAATTTTATADDTGGATAGSATGATSDAAGGAARDVAEEPTDAPPRDRVPNQRRPRGPTGRAQSDGRPTGAPDDEATDGADDEATDGADDEATGGNADRSSPPGAGDPTADVARPIPAVAPKSLDGYRVRGDTRLVPTEAVRLEMVKRGTSTASAIVKLCLDDRGRIDRVTMLKGSGFQAYDRHILREMRQWVYRPFQKNGRPTAVCSTVTFVYKLP